MRSENNKCSSLPSSYLLFLFSSRSHFSCLFSQYPLILSFLILCSLFYRLSTSSSLFLKSCHTLFPRASYLFACRCFILFCFSPSSLLLYFLLSLLYCFPQYFCVFQPWWKNVFHHILFCLFSLFSMLLWRLFMFSSFFFPLFFSLLLCGPNHI